MSDPKDPKDALTDILGNLVVEVVQAQAADALRTAAGAAADTGVCVNFMAVSERKGDTCGMIVLLSGPLPQDLIEGLKSYVNGMLQDYKSGLSKDTTTFRNLKPKTDDLGA